MEPRDEWWTQSLASEDLLADHLPHDLYDLLDVPSSSTQESIESSYRKLARKFHPDRNPEGQDSFREIQAAYEVLKDPMRRKLYDKRREGPQKPPRPLGRVAPKPTHRQTSSRLYGDTMSFYADEDIPPQQDEIEERESQSLFSKLLKRIR